jgi:uncharacterized repeat protein (TIGR03803 family)
MRPLEIFRKQIILAVALLAAVLLPAAAQAWTYKVISSFCGGEKCPEGDGPWAPLTMDTAGNLYGTTSGPGPGAVFKIDISGRKPKLNALYTFCRKANCVDGSSPFAGVILDVAGNLYGTAYGGGKNGQGVVYKLSPPPPGSKKWRLQILHSFCSACGDGTGPLAGLAYPGANEGALYDGISPLYGTAEIGGPHDGGVVFQLKPSSDKGHWRETILYSFCVQANCADGLNPYVGTLLIDDSGRILGTTQYGGANDGGTVFQLTPGGEAWNYAVLYSFCVQENCADGLYPIGGIYEDKQGNLFGTTGGDVGYLGGNVFKLTPQGQQYQLNVLHTFCLPHFCNDGSQPWATLIADKSGNVYGTTQYGGGNYNDGCSCGAEQFSVSATAQKQSSTHSAQKLDARTATIPGRR